MSQLPLSAVIFTFNEQKNIETCIQSISGWCQEIFIVDSGSTDKTLEVCQKYTSLIFTHDYVDHASQWDWTLGHLPFSFDWIMPLDADHVVSEKLKIEISDALLKPEPNINGYYSRHRYFFRGSRIRGFKPYSLRLFRRSQTHMDWSEFVDFRFAVNGKTKKLSGTLFESNQNESVIEFWINKHQKFSSRMAAEEVLRRAGVLDWSIRGSLLGNPDQRMIWIKNIWYRMPLYLRPFIYFFYRYFIRLGFLDGINGFLYHFLHAFWFRIIVDMKISELIQSISCGELTIEELKSFYVHEF